MNLVSEQKPPKKTNGLLIPMGCRQGALRQRGISPGVQSLRGAKRSALEIRGFPGAKGKTCERMGREAEGLGFYGSNRSLPLNNPPTDHVPVSMIVYPPTDHVPVLVVSCSRKAWDAFSEPRAKSLGISRLVGDISSPTINGCGDSLRCAWVSPFDTRLDDSVCGWQGMVLLFKKTKLGVYVADGSPPRPTGEIGARTVALFFATHVC